MSNQGLQLLNPLLFLCLVRLCPKILDTREQRVARSDGVKRVVGSVANRARYPLECLGLSLGLLDFELEATEQPEPVKVRLCGNNQEKPVGRSVGRRSSYCQEEAVRIVVRSPITMITPPVIPRKQSHPILRAVTMNFEQRDAKLKVSTLGYSTKRY